MPGNLVSDEAVHYFTANMLHPDKIVHYNSKHLTPGTPSPKGEGDVIR